MNHSKPWKLFKKIFSSISKHIKLRKLRKNIIKSKNHEEFLLSVETYKKVLHDKNINTYFPRSYNNHEMLRKHLRLNKEIFENPLDASIRIKHGNILRNLNFKKRTENNYKSAIAIDKTNAKNYTFLIDYYIDIKMYDEARNYLKKSLRYSSYKDNIDLLEQEVRINIFTNKHEDNITLFEVLTSVDFNIKPRIKKLLKTSYLELSPETKNNDPESLLENILYWKSKFQYNRYLNFLPFYKIIRSIVLIIKNIIAENIALFLPQIIFLSLLNFQVLNIPYNIDNLSLISYSLILFFLIIYKITKMKETKDMTSFFKKISYLNYIHVMLTIVVISKIITTKFNLKF